MVVSVMWIRFLEDWSYHKPSFTIAYMAGMTQNVTAECAERAITAGKAIRLTKPSKDAEPVEASSAPVVAVVMPPETKVEEHGATDDASRSVEPTRDIPAAPEHN